jgi:sugar-specific transcriptional regulator TrmB
MSREIYEIKEFFSLTNLEVEILDFLLDHPKGVTAKDVIEAFPNRGENVYRPLEKLVEMGLVEEIGGWPQRYTAKDLKKNYHKMIENRIIPMSFVSPRRSRLRVFFRNKKDQFLQAFRKIKNLFKK